MAFDTKYRPLLFSDVVGQKSTTTILKKLLDNGQVFHKSYIFAGPSGTGKTTTARILARAMLCDNLSDDMEPCNTCQSCQEIIQGKSSYNFVEMDAANNSGVDTIRAIVEGLDYYTLGGKDRRIYLLDEAHRLSASSLDALLKPMEDVVSGTQDKKLVCLFCTTEPEKIKDTVKARCMTFGIQEPSQEDVVQRLEYICEQEGFVYEKKALEAIFAHGKGHVRDMVNALERVSNVGDITYDNTYEQLGLRGVTKSFEILKALGQDIKEALRLTQEEMRYSDASTIYSNLADAALSTYRQTLGSTDGLGFLDLNLAKEVYSLYGDKILAIAERIVSNPKKVDGNILIAEIVILSRYLTHGSIPSMKVDMPPLFVQVNDAPETKTDNGTNTQQQHLSATEVTRIDTKSDEKKESKPDIERFASEAQELHDFADKFVNRAGPLSNINEADDEESKVKTTKADVKIIPVSEVANLRRRLQR